MKNKVISLCYTTFRAMYAGAYREKKRKKEKKTSKEKKKRNKERKEPR